MLSYLLKGMPNKLIARELNVSSDIDLIYVYEDDGQTPGLAGTRMSRGGRIRRRGGGALP